MFEPESLALDRMLIFRRRMNYVDLIRNKAHYSINFSPLIRTVKKNANHLTTKWTTGLCIRFFGYYDHQPLSRFICFILANCRLGSFVSFRMVSFCNTGVRLEMLRNDNRTATHLLSPTDTVTSNKAMCFFHYHKFGCVHATRSIILI